MISLNLRKREIPQKPMPIDPVKIPQNVYIEDRIVGPLTLRQIIIMAVGGGFSYAIYASLSKAYGHVDILTTAIVWSPAAIAALFAIVKINDLSLARIVLLIIERMLKAPVRTWTPREGISINIKVLARQNEDKQKPHRPVVDKSESEARSKIRELSTVVDTVFETEPEAHTVPIRESPPAHEEEPKTLPVNPARIKADPANPNDNGPAVFRDIIPHHA